MPSGDPIPFPQQGSAAETRTIVTAFVRAYVDGDMEQLTSFLTEGFRYRQNSRSKYAVFWADCTGVHEFLGALGDIARDWELVRYEPIEIIAEGNRAAVRSDAELRFRETDRSVRAEVALFIRLEGRKVAEVVEFHDSLLVAEGA